MASGQTLSPRKADAAGARATSPEQIADTIAHLLEDIKSLRLTIASAKGRKARWALDAYRQDPAAVREIERIDAEVQHAQLTLQNLEIALDAAEEIRRQEQANATYRHELQMMRLEERERREKLERQIARLRREGDHQQVAIYEWELNNPSNCRIAPPPPGYEDTV